MSKYEKLWIYIKNSNKNELSLSFCEIENICGFKIDHSFLRFKKELNNFGYDAIKISLKEKIILFKKIVI